MRPAGPGSPRRPRGASASGRLSIRAATGPDLRGKPALPPGPIAFPPWRTHLPARPSSFKQARRRPLSSAGQSNRLVSGRSSVRIGQGARAAAPGSWLLAPGSWLLAPGSWPEAWLPRARNGSAGAFRQPSRMLLRWPCPGGRNRGTETLLPPDGSALPLRQEGPPARRAPLFFLAQISSGGPGGRQPPGLGEDHSMKKAKRITNSAATIQVAACTSRARPVASLIAA